MSTTDFDGSLESAAELLVLPETEEPETVEEETDAEAEVEDVEQDYEDESLDDDEEDDSPESEEEGDEEDDDDTESDDDEESAPQVFTVKVDGKETEVTLDELKRGYSGQQYVQKGMQENAELRKQTEHAFLALQSERQQMAQLMQQVQSGQLMQPPQPPAQELLQSDPIRFMEEKERYEQDARAFHQQQQQFQAVMAKQSEAEAQAQQAHLAREAQLLVEKIPEFADKEKSVQFRETLRNRGSEYYGYSPDELANVLDHRAVVVLNDAIKYRELMAGKDKAIEKAKSKPKKTVKANAKKPTSTSNRELRQRRSRLKQTGSLDDAVALIMNS